MAEAIESELGSRVQRLDSSTRELGYAVAPADLLDCCRVLRDAQALKFEMLMDLTGVDYLSYGRTEWDTASATSTGFSRGVGQGNPEAGDRLAETAYKPAGRFD